MAIAVKTFLDDASPIDSPDDKKARIAAFPPKFLPYATHFAQDLEICYCFFDALVHGVRALDKEMSIADKAVWETASRYLEARR
jgi:hypothetical protein